MAPKKKPLPLRRSRQLIEDKRVNVARRTRERIALLFPSPEYSVDKATQTEIPMREVHVDIENWHSCLSTFCFFWGSAKPSFGWYKVTKNSY